MKRKFFSLMVAACAALFSFSGLTGCSGGGAENEATYGIVTLDDFEKGRKGFRISCGVGAFDLMPDSSSSDGTSWETNPPGEEDNPYDTGLRSMNCTINGTYSAWVTYNISGWKDGIPEDGTATDPNSTTLTIVINTKDVSAASKDANLLLALGTNPDNDRLVTSINIGLQYSNYGVDGTYTVSYIKDGETKTLPVSPSGRFMVGKN